MIFYPSQVLSGCFNESLEMMTSNQAAINGFFPLASFAAWQTMTPRQERNVDLDTNMVKRENSCPLED
jgi:hypothetical protein